MAVHSIAVATDFSPQAEHALTSAMHIAARFGARVALLHVVQEPDIVDVLGEATLAKDGLHGALTAHLESERARLEALAERCAAVHGVEVIARVARGAPADDAVRLAEEVRADLVVVGTHGRTGVGRLLLGSVAERVARLVSDRTLVVRGDGVAERGCSRVLVATDFSPAAGRALQSALELRADDGVVEVVHFWHLPATATAHWGPAGLDRESVEPLRRQLIEYSLDACHKFVERYAPNAERIAVTQRQQEPVRGVRDLVDTAAYDLVAMGSHGRRGLRRLLLGSVAEATLRFVDCSVLIAHAGA